MPKIRVIQQNTSVNNLGGGVTARPQQMVSAVAAMAPGLERSISNLQSGIDTQRGADIAELRIKKAQDEAIKRQEENDAAVWAGDVLSSAHLQMNERMIQLQETADPGAQGFTPNFLKEYDDYVQKTLENAPTDTARKYISSRFNSMRTTLGTSALTFEANARRTYRVGKVTESIGKNAKLVQDDPAAFDVVYGETMAVINALDIPPNEKLQLINTAKQQLPYASVLGQVQRNPRAAAAKLRGTIPTSGEKGIVDLRAEDPPQYGQFGKRPDGSEKGSGYLGVLKAENGDYVTEYSIGVQVDGEEVDIPSLVPTLTRAEVKSVLSGKVTPAIQKKAKAFAESRISQGLPIFAQEGEQQNIRYEAGADKYSTVIDFIFAQEGGFNENDGNGPVNFGINQAANPDVDVRNLTKDQANEIYRQRYWEEINGDDLPPGVAMIAMDMAVNQGVNFALKVLKESGGSIPVIAQKRREKYQELVRLNPRRYGKYKDTWMERIDDAEQKALSMGQAEGIGLFDVNNALPGNVKQINDPAYDGLDFNQRIKLLGVAETLENQERSVFKQNVKARLQDFNAMAANGVNLPAGAIPSLVELTDAFGQSDGIKIFNDEVKPMLVLNSDMQKFSSMSVNERMARIQERAPIPGDNFLAQQQRQAIMIKANENLVKEMEADPAAYAIKYSSNVSKSFAELQAAFAGENEATIDEVQNLAANFAEQTIAEQNRLGVLDPIILPKNLASGIVRQFSDQPEGGSNAAGLIQQQAETWGDYWPQVYGELSKDLPPAALVIGSLGPGSSGLVAEQLARISQLKPEELKAGLDPTDIKDTDAAVVENMVPFLNSMHSVVGGARTYKVFSDEIKKLALFNVKSGQGTSEAAANAYEAVIGANYDFVTNDNNENVSYRVPLGINANEVSYKANEFLQSIDVNGLMIPRSLYGLDLEQSKDVYADALKEHAYWVTDPKEQGLALYVNGSAVLYDNGEPVMRDWNSLRKEATETTIDFIDNYKNRRGGVL